ncbi:AMP-binding protein [Actinomadura formosensis]|uniref:AMP-binding protein n=1 Tax=Actinomadura formosensis TaxID=60706 RepID=UPI003D8DFDBF
MHLGQIAAQTPDKPAVIMAGSGRSITFRELNEESNRLAQLLRAEGLRPGDHIAFMLENHPLYLAIAWAAQRSGLYYTAISSRLQPGELAYIVENCEAKVFITGASMETAARSAPDVPLRLMLGGTAPGYESYEERVGRYPSTPIEDECEGMDMLYSSGTTGRPKGVKPPLSKASMGEAGPLYMLISHLFSADADSVYLCPAPLYHAAPLRYSLVFHRLGATVVVMEKFDPEQALAAIEKYRATHSQWVPTMFIRMLKLPEETRARYDMSSLTCAVHAAAPCPVPVKEQMIGWWGPILHEYYAGTEGNCFVYTNTEDWLAHKGTVGRPILGEVHVCDEDGRELPPGEPGTLYFGNGPTFEYHADEAGTAASRDPRGRGWTTLGDVGYVDEDGFLHLTDRRAYMIISGGVNIYPQEAENVLAVHPKVADVAVFGVPDAEMGEAVKAVVQPLSMDDAGPELAAELIAYCRDRLAHYKCPRTVDFRPELPRHPTGKLYKRLLKDEYRAGERLATA